MNKTVEINDQINEAETSKVEKKERKLPNPITFTCKSGDILRFIPKGEKTYDKEYVSSNREIRKTKTVKLPISREGQDFSNVWELFEHMLTLPGYMNY